MKPRRGIRSKQRMLEPFDNSCVECGALGKVVSGAIARPHKPALHSRLFLMCGCGAFVSCHPGTAISMGRPAGSETRYLRAKAHEALDVRWQREDTTAWGMSKARQKAYAWLARGLGIRFNDCHIGRFDAHTCRRAIALCAEDERKAA